MISLRAVRAGEEAQLRELRMRAVADAPAAFGATAEEVAGRTEEEWSQLAAGGEEICAYVAVDGERWVGMAAGRWFERERSMAQLWGMWVEPEMRGQRVGERLVAAVRSWAATHGARFIRLGVMEGSRAIPFYERLGFVETGETRPLRRDPSITALYMVRPA